MLCQIDLAPIYDHLVPDINAALTSFASSNPNLMISALGIFSDVFHGWASLHLDTSLHSAAHVAKYSKMGGFDQDEAGKFCNNCFDFRFQLLEHDFYRFPDCYDESIEAFEFIQLDGSVITVPESDGDIGMNNAVFPMLKQISIELEPLAILNKEEIFRIGVQMNDSPLIEFRQIKT